MNIISDLLMNHHLFSTITLFPTKQNWIFYIFVISNNQSFPSQILRVAGPMGEKLDLSLVPWEFNFKVVIIVE